MNRFSWPGIFKESKKRFKEGQKFSESKKMLDIDICKKYKIDEDEWMDIFTGGGDIKTSDNTIEFEENEYYKITNSKELQLIVNKFLKDYNIKANITPIGMDDDGVILWDVK